MDLLLDLLLALILGMLVGVERGTRVKRSGYDNVIGIRTFGLIGLFGALTAMIASITTPTFLGFGFIVVGAFLITAFISDIKIKIGVGATTVIAAFITYILGSLVILDYKTVAIAVAVIMTLLLSLKPELHRFITLIEESELNAALKFLLISVVILPVLPNKGHGPWEAINPFELWWMVVLITGISFVGYIFIKLMGARRGILLTGLFGGIVSSTVVTLNFSRLVKEKDFSNIFAAGILVTSGTMFPRMLLYVLVVNYNLFSHLIIPIVMMTVCGFC